MGTKRREYMMIDGEWVKIIDYMGGIGMNIGTDMVRSDVEMETSFGARWKRVQADRLHLFFKHKVLIHMNSGSTVEFDLPNWYTKDDNQLHEDVASMCQEDLKVGDAYYKSSDMKFAECILVRSALVYDDGEIDLDSKISDVEFARNRSLYDHIIDKYKQYMRGEE